MLLLMMLQDPRSYKRYVGIHVNQSTSPIDLQTNKLTRQKGQRTDAIPKITTDSILTLSTTIKVLWYIVAVVKNIECIR
jgi:hypothetical protein